MWKLMIVSPPRDAPETAQYWLDQLHRAGAPVSSVHMTADPVLSLELDGLSAVVADHPPGRPAHGHGAGPTPGAVARVDASGRPFWWLGGTLGARWRCVGATPESICLRLHALEYSSVAWAARGPLVDLWVDVEGDQRSRFEGALGDDYYGFGAGELPAIVGALLAGRGATLALAESCTGGLVGAALTAVSGASSWFLGGALVYSNAEKVRACDVAPALLTAHGAVSEPVARALAEGIRQRTGATYGAAVTGVAGPSGGTAEKPVGTVWFSVSSLNGTVAHRASFGPLSRADIREASVSTVLGLVRRVLLHGNMPAGPASPILSI